MEDSTKNFLANEAAFAADELGIKDETPNVEQPVAEPVEETPAEPVVEEAQTPQPGDIVQPQVDAPVEDEEEDEDFIPRYELPQNYQQPQQQPVAAPQQPVVPALDPSQFTDQFGNVDMAKFGQAIQQRDQALVQQVSQAVMGEFSQRQSVTLQQADQLATQRVMEAKAEERAWERTFEKYPEVKQNKDLRDQIQKMRLGEVATQGKNVSPVKVADRFFKLIGQARQEGVKQATETVKIQSSAHLETANNTASEKGLKTQQDWSNIASRDRRQSDAARTAVLKDMLERGVI